MTDLNERVAITESKIDALEQNLRDLRDEVTEIGTDQAETKGISKAMFARINAAPKTVLSLLGLLLAALFGLYKAVTQ